MEYTFLDKINKKRTQDEVNFDINLERELGRLWDLAMDTTIEKKFYAFLKIFYTEKLAHKNDFEMEKYFTERYSKKVWDKKLESADLEELVDFILS